MQGERDGVVGVKGNAIAEDAQEEEGDEGTAGGAYEGMTTALLLSFFCEWG